MIVTSKIRTLWAPCLINLPVSPATVIGLIYWAYFLA